MSTESLSPLEFGDPERSPQEDYCLEKQQLNTQYDEFLQQQLQSRGRISFFGSAISPPEFTFRRYKGLWYSFLEQQVRLFVKEGHGSPRRRDAEGRSFLPVRDVSGSPASRHDAGLSRWTGEEPHGGQLGFPRRRGHVDQHDSWPHAGSAALFYF